ncbi:MFS transporter [Novosphingobium organovorum]|nr:MFS transporter [Novosphingobium organovorum]
MNLGFFGLQLSFGLLVANSSPIFRTLGASEALLPLLWLAGPVTGMVVQPLVGALSDRTVTRFGRRTPYLLTGAAIAALGLWLMPFSPVLWVAVALVWLLDTANNLILEPYRAYVVDRLPPGQRPAGFLLQSAFTGLSQTLAHLLPSLLALFVHRHLTDANGIALTVRATFVIGAIVTASTIVYSLVRVPETALPIARPATPAPASAQTAAARTGLFAWAIAQDLVVALRDMPRPMRQLALPMLCQWYAMFAFWQYFTEVVARTRFATSDPTSDAYREATLTAQQLGAIYNAIAFLAALAMIPLLRRVPIARLHAACLALSGLAMAAIPFAGHSQPLLYTLMLGIGIGWAGMMGNNHALLGASLPPGRIGTYMGIFNLFIVIPMLFETLTLPLIFQTMLNGDPARVLFLAALLMGAGSVSILHVKPVS